jgi:hypothetical protein
MRLDSERGVTPRPDLRHAEENALILALWQRLEAAE